MNNEEIIGKIFGNLKVINRAENNPKIRGRVYNCECVCGVNKIVAGTALRAGKAKSCGCINDKTKNYIGKKFGSLLVLKKSDTSKFRGLSYICLCDCGEEKTTRVYSLLTGATKSCGCWLQSPESKDIDAAANVRINIIYNREYYKDTDLTFEEFYELSQRNCYYCDVEPKQYSGGHKLLGVNQDLYAFIYNGLDRINNNLGHIKSNVVPCCKICNYMKSNLQLNDFLRHIKSIYNYFILQQNRKFYISGNEMLSFNIVYDKKEFTALNNRFLGSVNRRGGDITLEQFIKITKLNCVYCNAIPSNKAKYNNKLWYYSGMDRINSSGSYTIDNIVPCCKHCNRFKSNYTVEEFCNNIIKIVINLKLNYTEYNELNIKGLGYATL